MSMVKSNAELATELVINYFESENITVGTPEIKEIINKWETIFDPIDFVSLAALTIYNPSKVELSRSEIRKIRDFYFPL